MRWPFKRKEKIALPLEEGTGLWELKHVCMCGWLYDSKVEVCGQCGERFITPIVGRWKWVIDPNKPDWFYTIDGKDWDLPQFRANTSEARWEAKERWNYGTMWVAYTDGGIFYTKMKSIYSEPEQEWSATYTVPEKLGIKEID